MNKDYTYCSTKDCIHRRGCKRWLGNYTAKELHDNADEIVKNRYVEESECIPNYDDVNCKNNYSMLDRFRLSTGEEHETKLDTCI